MALHEMPSPLLEPAAPARPALSAVTGEGLDFDLTVRTLRPRLQRYATRRLGDAHEAEELVQEALLRAYQHRAEFATRNDVTAWSTCVTGRLVIDRLRVRGRSTTVADVPEGRRRVRDTADIVVARDEARTALDALDAMPPRQAAVLWAREVEGLGYDQIGTRFGMTEPAVRSILTRARKALRAEYASRGGTLPFGGLAAIAPWVDGMGWLHKMRDGLARMTAPSSTGVAGVGLLGASLLTVIALPWLGSAAGPSPRPAIVAHDMAATLADPPADTPHGGPATGAGLGVGGVPTGSRGDGGAGSARQAHSVVWQATFGRTPCVSTAAAAKAGPARCGIKPTGIELRMGPELPANPTGSKHIAFVISGTSQCPNLPEDVPMKCTTQQ